MVNLSLILEHGLSLTPRIELIIEVSTQDRMTGINAHMLPIEVPRIDSRFSGTNYLSKGF